MYELLSLPDLVQAKKTQRSKDWPMLQRLLEAHYLQHRVAGTPEQQRFWLHELRTPELLVEATQRWPQLAEQVAQQRPLLLLAQSGQLDPLRAGPVSGRAGGTPARPHLLAAIEGGIGATAPFDSNQVPDRQRPRIDGWRLWPRNSCSFVFIRGKKNSRDEPGRSEGFLVGVEQKFV